MEYVRKLPVQIVSMVFASSNNITEIILRKQIT